jgi:hypothetical protein
MFPHHNPPLFLFEASTRKNMHAKTLAVLTKPLYFPNMVFQVVVMATR